VSVSLDDSPIDARGEAKVIGIDDQTSHRVSLAGGQSSACIPKRGFALTDFSPVAYSHRRAVSAQKFLIGF
jgi:hypothetical protein